ncbi:MAG TPA: Maf family protein [Terriglobia bacterium]|nr:Maf family protein [Terriglobia bacterium]
MHGTLSPSKWVRLKFSAIKEALGWSGESKQTVENNSGFTETLATGKHAASGVTKRDYETSGSHFVLNSGGLGLASNESRMTTIRQWVLASSSPRRQELLKLLVPDFEVVPSDVDESVHAAERPEAMVARLARDKALAVQERHPSACIVGADTVVVCEEAVLGKPVSQEDAGSMLRTLSGKTHQVLTGVCLVHLDSLFAECVTTDVTFSRLLDSEIEGYVQSGEPLDKAGAYAIQGLGARFVERISGCYFNVVGLPVSTLYQMIKRLGPDIS